jgi:asparagine synthase (glutamine-hydrolysing)
MSTLAGIIVTENREDCTHLLHGMISSVKEGHCSRSGRHIVEELGIYVGWISSDNEFDETQLSVNEAKDVALVFCGECFFDPQTSLKPTNSGCGVAKSSGGWLIDLYEEQGVNCFDKLNGTFSGFLIDQRRNKAFLFNDRYGVGRIYWHESNGSFYFASEAKALLQILPGLRAFDNEGVAQFLNFGCTLGPRTLFKGIQTIPGGSVWKFEDGKCHKTTYFSPKEWERQTPLSVEDFESEFQNTFTRVVPRYFESESRIGISLTAGLDTRMLMACQPSKARDLLTYTFDGPTDRTADSRLAAQVADALGLEHHILRLGHDFFSDFASHVDRTVNITDGCFGVTGAHEIYLNGLARQLAPLRLTGNYGGEILREVSTFKSLGLSPSLLSPDAGVLTSSFKNTLERHHPVTFAAFREIPWKLFGGLRAGQSQLTIRCPYLDNEIVALAYRAPKELRRAAKPAIRLIERTKSVLSKTPTDMGLLGQPQLLQGMVRRVAAKVGCKIDYLASEGFPPTLRFLDSLVTNLASVVRVAGTHKYLRYRIWFRHQLSEYVRDAISDVRARQSPLWNSKFLGRMVDDHIAGRANYVRELGSVITLGAVERLLFQARPVATVRNVNEPELVPSDKHSAVVT